MVKRGFFSDAVKKVFEPAYLPHETVLPRLRIPDVGVWEEEGGVFTSFEKLILSYAYSAVPQPVSRICCETRHLSSSSHRALFQVFP